MKKKHKNTKWFIKVRGSYLPNTGTGWLTYIPYVAYMIVVPLIAYENTDNIAVSFLITVPNWVAATIVMTYVASNNS